LRDPSLAQGLPDGDVLVCDSGNDRIVVIDRQTKAIVWQYGHTGVPGSRPGYLDAPDSATLVP
jgi:DNA-binding beta-propeller fold protein YncE